MNGPVADAETLARYAVESSKLKQDGVHWRIFLPDSRGETSVFRIDGLDAAAIAQIGRDEVAAVAGKTLLGWGEVYASDARPQLTVTADEPPERHAVMRSWPAETEKRQELALRLASLARTTRLP